MAKARPGAVYLFASNPEVIRNYDVTYAFRQDSSFFYLTGFEEPDSFIVILPAASQGGAGHRLIMFVPPRDPEREMWDGERYGIEGAREVFGADEAYPIGELATRLPSLLKGVDQVHYRIGLPVREEIDRLVLGAIEAATKAQGRSGRALPAITDPGEVLGEMRLFKGPEEIELMRRSCQITAQAHVAAMRETRPGMIERDVEAIVDYQFKRGGCARNGYWSIVAGGRNATCLHYRSNNDTLKDGDLLLIDAGGEYQYYSADITRTFPVGRKFSEAQAKVYDLVLKAQVEAVAAVRPGATLPGIHAQVCRTLTEGFLSLGLLKGNAEEIIKSGGHKRFYPHNTSHWLGMDVHDAGLYLKGGEPRKLEPGMVLTIEPGFYVQPRDADAPAAYRDIGIRIEDDVLVTPTGNEVLTAGAPKTREEIEKLRG